MTHEKLAKLKEDAAADPTSRVLQLAVEVLEKELALRAEVDRAISEVVVMHHADVYKAKSSPKVVGRLIGLVRGRAGGGDPTYIREQLEAVIAALDSGRTR